MAVGLQAPSVLEAVPGVRVAATAAGIRYRGRDDLVLIELAEGGTTAGVFTRNAFCAAPVMIAKAHLAAASPRYLLINAGNANAGTGQSGLDAARLTCEALSRVTGCVAETVLPFSTGVIGELLPAERIVPHLPALHEALAEDGWLQAARAIMTTDTLPKGVSRKVEIGGQTVTLTGIAKGSGMIHPDMATMLAFIATDAMLEEGLLQDCLQQAVAGSFNSITVDGDTSTNDACMLLASGASGVAIGQENRGMFQAALDEVCQVLAQAIIRDGEGATKFVTIEVDGAASESEARAAAFTVAHSPLVKTALFASDANWGRILAAVGRADIEALDVSRVNVFLDDVCIVRDGARAAEYTEARGSEVMKRAEIVIRIALNRGQAAARIWTCDLSHEYVSINADYRS
jgi:glutamate N-acetyltransferase/amino-acid N-acetyltransferase